MVSLVAWPTYAVLLARRRVSCWRMAAIVAIESHGLGAAMVIVHSGFEACAGPGIS
jgi:hypothetical protein